MRDPGIIALFSGLEPQALDIVLSTARQIRVPRERYLFFEHEPATTLYVVRHGWVRLFKISGDGRQSVIRFVGPSEIAGMSALINTGVYRLTAQAAAPCQLLAWDYPDLERLMETHPQIRENAFRLLSGYLDDLQQQYLELATERVEQRIAHALVRIVTRHGTLDQSKKPMIVPLSQRDLADLAGVTHYTVSRVLGEWRKQAVIATGRTHIQILDLQQLIAHADL